MQLIRPLFLVATVIGLTLSPLLLFSSTAQAAPAPRWTLVQAGPECFNLPTGEQSYLYNVDENGDGVVDFAVWFHESDLVVFFSRCETYPFCSLESPRPFLLADPGRSLHQWAFAWFGYQATGACSQHSQAYDVAWEIRPSPRSIYATHPYLQFAVQIGVAEGSTFRVICRPLSYCGNEEYLLRAEYWFASFPGALRDNWPHNGFHGVIDSWGSWSFSNTDWKTLIQNGGHPPYPLQYVLASSDLVPHSSECMVGGYPHGRIDVTDVDGRFTAARYGHVGELRQLFFWNECWFVGDGPTAAFTHSPSSPPPGQTITFDGSLSADPHGVVSSYAWNFGDGTGASGAVVNHAYPNAGTYTVSLTVRDNSGFLDTKTAQITIGSGASGGGGGGSCRGCVLPF